jgi:hypothetical protein
MSGRQAARMKPKTGLKMIHLPILRRLSIVLCLCGVSD